LRLRVDDERLRVVPDVPLDLRAVGDFLVLAAFVVDRVLDLAVVDFARVVDRRVPLAADADLRVDAAFVPDDFRRDVDFVPVVAFARDLDAAEDFRLDDFRPDEPRSVNRFVSPASTVVAFSSCATPRATSSCARATALSTGLRSLDRFDLVFFLAAIASPISSTVTPAARSMDRNARGVCDITLPTQNTPRGGHVHAPSCSQHATASLRRSSRATCRMRVNGRFCC
jgi:hypothetical protein